MGLKNHYLNIGQYLDLYFLPIAIKQLKICAKKNQSLKERESIKRRIKEFQIVYNEIKKLTKRTLPIYIL